MLKEVKDYIVRKKAASLDEILAETGLDRALAESILLTLEKKGKIQECTSAPKELCGGCSHQSGCAFSGPSSLGCAPGVKYFTPV